MAKKGKDGLTAAQRKQLTRYNRIGAGLAILVMALFMVYYQMTGLSRGSEPGPEVYRSGTATVSECQREASTLWSMYHCRGDDLVWTTNGPDPVPSHVQLRDRTDGVTIWAHQPVSGQVAVEAHATQSHELSTDVYRDYEILMPVGQFREAGSTYFLLYLAAMFVCAMAVVYGVDRFGRRRILALATR